MAVIVLQKDYTWKPGVAGAQTEFDSQPVEEAAWLGGDMSIGPRLYVYARAASFGSTGTLTLSFKGAAVREGGGRFATMGPANDIVFSSSDTYPLTKQVGLSNYGAWLLWSASVNSTWQATDYVKGDIHVVTFDGKGNARRTSLPLEIDKGR